MRVHLVGLSVVLALEAAAPSSAQSPASGAQQPPAAARYSETKERLSIEAMEGLVTEAMALARAQDWTGAQVAFERKLERVRARYGANSIAVSDALAAFMILNFRDDRAAEALSYAGRTEAAVRAAWGADSLEYALLLNDLAQMDFEHRKPAVSPEALARLRTTYRIRRAKLGPWHKETISTLIYLGRLQGQRTVTGGDIRRAAPAIALLRQAIEETEAHRAPDNDDNLWARAILTQTYARNGDLHAAVTEFNAMQEKAELQRVDTSKYFPAYAEALKEGGFDMPADEMLKA
jgi:hypothetical protein